MSGQFVEQAVLLDNGQSLVGVVARPVAQPGPPGGQQPAVVILNTGIIHKVGHHRMYVTMSRLFAAAGRTVLRFDFSGIGDSEQRVDRLSPLQASLADIRQALDWLQKNHDVSRFILVGLCAGADHAVLYGHTDDRVVGLVLMDPTIPPTARFYFHYIMQRLRNLKNWASVLTGRSGLISLLRTQLLSSARPRVRGGEFVFDDLKFSVHLERCYRHAVRNGIKLLAVFTKVSPRQSYREQFIDAFPSVAFAEQLQTQFFADSDHVFSRTEDRDALNRIVLDWGDSLGAASQNHV